MRKLMVIGLDGVPPRVLFDGWRDDLPHLRRLMECGVWGPLRSCDPPITVPAWASMMTGKDPGQLGVYGFRDRRSYGYDDRAMVHAKMIAADRVWDLLSRAGKHVVVLGVPPTYPPPVVNGVAVSCFLTPSRASAYTYPPGMKSEIERAADGYVFDVDDFRTADKDALLARIYRKTGKQFAVARHLLTTQPWDFFMMVEMGPDRIHHGFWQYFDRTHPQYERGGRFEQAVHDYYVCLDAEIGALLALAPADAAVMVVSDHGAQTMQGALCINQWLIERGYLRLHPAPAKSVKGVTPFSLERVDWNATTAWGDGGYCGRVFLNVVGREPRGIVAPEEYEQVRSDLITAFATIRSVGGRAASVRAHRPEDLYTTVTGIAPDLLVYADDLRCRVVSSVGFDGIFTSDNDTGPDGANHDWDGVFIWCANRAAHGGGPLARYALTDVAPTVLDYFGLPVPDDMIGMVIDTGPVADAASAVRVAAAARPSAHASGNV